MKRRAGLILALALGLLAVRLAAEGQQARQPIIGVTLAGSLPNPHGAALRRTLTELGWVDGQNIRLEYRYPRADLSVTPGSLLSCCA